MKDKTFYIVDTTLRDGAQTPGTAFSPKECVLIAALFDEAGIYQIEAGVPAAGRQEKENVLLIKQTVKNSLVSVWNRLKETDIEASLSCKADIIHIGVPSSDLQIKMKLKSARGEIERKMSDCIKLAASQKVFVSVGFEDSTRADINFLLELAKTAKESGAQRIRYSDTVGIAFPSFVRQSLRAFKGLGLEIEAHFHNDLGMAEANSYEALKNGAQYINTTFCGLGERAGNCDIVKFAKLARLTHSCSLNFEKLSQAENKIRSLL
jgi:homocitrate synthase NifV